MKLLSWNIQWGRGMDGKVDLQRILKTIGQLGQFDVICLQEVAINFPGLPGSIGENQFDILSDGLPGYTAIYGAATDLPGSNGKRSQFGNVIFSRLPVGQIWRHLLPWSAEPETSSMQRALIEVIVTTAFGPIRIQTTHLEYYSQYQRKAQIDAIRRLHAEACAMSNHSPQSIKQNRPLDGCLRPAEAILCGDLNFAATASERSQMLTPFENGTPALHDTRTLMYPNKPHAPTVGIHAVDFVDQPECFDYIFITEGLKNRLKTYHTDPKTQASDHQPVWIELN